MNYRVRIEDRWYEVEVGDLQARPITAIVEGERYEVWPERESASHAGASGTAPAVERPRRKPTPSPAGESRPVAERTNGKDTAIASPNGSALKTVRAPIPGVIVSLAIEPGTTVSTGQELCVLEAMKMKNSIRAARAGRIAAIHVSPGQAVKHRDVLVEFKD